MTGVVVEASTAPAWCFPDESSEYADAVLVALEGKTILAPSIWPLEIANAMLVGERTKRLRQPIVAGHVLPLAREYGLSVYGAACLELSIRCEAPLGEGREDRSCCI